MQRTPVCAGVNLAKRELLLPQPSQASAALVAAAPLKVAMVVPVDAVPKVVAMAGAAVGANASTPAPGATPAAAVPLNTWDMRYSLQVFKPHRQSRLSVRSTDLPPLINTTLS